MGNYVAHHPEHSSCLQQVDGQLPRVGGQIEPLMGFAWNQFIIGINFQCGCKTRERTGIVPVAVIIRPPVIVIMRPPTTVFMPQHWWRFQITGFYTLQIWSNTKLQLLGYQTYFGLLRGIPFYVDITKPFDSTMFTFLGMITPAGGRAMCLWGSGSL